jgi:hypothetical protein
VEEAWAFIDAIELAWQAADAPELFHYPRRFLGP